MTAPEYDALMEEISTERSAKNILQRKLEEMQVLLVSRNDSIALQANRLSARESRISELIVVIGNLRKQISNDRLVFEYANENSDNPAAVSSVLTKYLARDVDDISDPDLS